MKGTTGFPHGIVERIRGLHREAVALRKMAGASTITDDLAVWISAQLVDAARRAAEEAGPNGLPLAVWLQYSSALDVLRRGDHGQARLELRRKEVEIARERTGKWMQARFDKWVEDPEVQARFMPKPLSPEEKERRILAVFGMTELPEHVMRKAREQVRAEDRAKAEAEAQAQAEVEAEAGCDREAEVEAGSEAEREDTTSPPDKRCDECAEHTYDNEHGSRDSPDDDRFPWPRPPPHWPKIKIDTEMRKRLRVIEPL